MIVYQVETIDAVYDEVQELLLLHYEELTMHKEHIKLEPNWDKYRGMEKGGFLSIITARDDLKLIGYSVFFLNKHIHYDNTLMAANDVLFLNPDYRKGMTGIKLIKFAETKLKELKVVKVVWHVKYSNNWSPILNRMGYTNEEIIVSKILGDA